MSFITLRIPLSFRLFLFATLTTSWVSGVVFFILNTWFIVEGEFGPEKHPWQQPALMLHGAAAFLMMIIYGGLLFSHIASGLALAKWRYLGMTLCSAFAFQIITAYALYYLAAENIRTIIAYLHAAVGFLIPFLLTAHIIRGIQNRRRYKISRIQPSGT